MPVFKLSKISLNGKSLELDDPNAAQVGENTFEGNDLPIFDSATNVFKPINKSNLVEVDNEPKPNSTKLITSGAVYDALQNIDKDLKNIDLTVAYNPLTQKLTFSYTWDSQTDNNLVESINLFVISINTAYDTGAEELKFSNIIDVLTLSPGSSGFYAEKNIAPYSEDRVFYFILVNNYQNKQICNLNVNSLLIAGSNEKTNNQITVTSSTQSGRHILTFTSQQNVDVDIQCSARLVGSQDSSEDCVVNTTLVSGTSSTSIAVPIGSQMRTAYPTIVPAETSEVYNYILSTGYVSVGADLARVEVNVTPADNDTKVSFNLGSRPTPNSPIDVKMICESTNGELVLSGVLDTGQSYCLIDYANEDIISNLVDVRIGDRSTDGTNKYFISNSSLLLLIDPDGNPYE